jgi:hypothetical protein
LDLPTQRANSGNRKRHVPEVVIRIAEFDADVGLAIAGAANANNVALHALRGVIIHEKKLLADSYDLIHLKKSAVAINRLRMRLDAELFSGITFSVNGERNS